MRKLILLLAFAGLVYGQPVCTQITQTLYQAGARPVPMNGSITLTQGYTAQNGSFVVVQSQAPIQVVNGRLSVCPSPGSYEADYTVNPIAPLTETVQFTRYWTVPLTGGPYKLTDIPAGANGPIEGQVFAPPVPQTFAVGATGPQGPAGPSGTGNAPYTRAIHALTGLTIAADIHGQGTSPEPLCSDSPSPSPSHSLACDYTVDYSTGTVTYSWPGGFTGWIVILGGGTGPRGATGATGAPGPTGPMGSLGSFGPLPTTPGNWIPIVTVTSGPNYSYGYLNLAFSLAALSNAQLSLMNNATLLTLTN